MIQIDYVVEYDENSVAWLVNIDRPDERVPIEHGMRLTVVEPVP